MNFDDVVIGEKYIAIADENGNFSTYTDYPEAFFLYANSCNDEKVIKEMTSALKRYCTGRALNIGDILTCIGKFVDRDGCNIGLFDQAGNDGWIHSYVLDTSFVNSLEKDCKKTHEKITKDNYQEIVTDCDNDLAYNIVNELFSSGKVSVTDLAYIVKSHDCETEVFNEIKDTIDISVIKEGISLSDFMEGFDSSDITDAVENNRSKSSIKDIVMSLIAYAM